VRAGERDGSSAGKLVPDRTSLVNWRIDSRTKPRNGTVGQLTIILAVSLSLSLSLSRPRFFSFRRFARSLAAAGKLSLLAA